MNLHQTPEMRQMSIYHLCYCLQSLLLLLRNSPKTSEQSVRKPNRPLLVFNSPWLQLSGEYSEGLKGKAA